MILFGIVFFSSILLFAAIGKLCTGYLQRKRVRTTYKTKMERSLKNQEKRSGN